MTEKIWTEERVELLKRLWEDGLTGSQVAARLGHGISRCAVAGKVHRFKLEKRNNQASTRQPKQKQSTAIRLLKTATPKLASVPKRVVSEPAADMRIAFLEVSNKTCRWPIGDPGHKDFKFCGASPHAGSSYCEYHRQLGTQKTRSSTGGDFRFAPRMNARLT
jgi:GcrA cell cycle regulator